MSESAIFCSDIHSAVSYADDLAWTSSGSPKEYRRYSTWQTRFDSIISKANLLSLNVIHLGDAKTINGTFAALENFITRAQNINGELYNIVGNHDYFATDAADYYSAISGKQGSMENVYTDTNGWKSYTFDIGEIRFLVLFNIGFLSVLQAHIDWLEAQLAASDMPMVLLSHAPCYPISPYIWSYPPNYQDVLDVLAAAENFQCAFNGHYHWDCPRNKIDDAWHYHISGSILAPNVNDNKYYLVEIEPNAVYTPHGWKANIKITDYGNHGYSKTKDFTKYAIC